MPQVETGLTLTHPRPHSPAGGRWDATEAECARLHRPAPPWEAFASQAPLATEQSSDHVWFSSSLFYFVETGWYFIALQRCPEAMYIMFLNRTLFPDELSHSLRRAWGCVSPCVATREGARCSPASPGPWRSRLHREAFLPSWAWWSPGQGESGDTPPCSLEPSLAGARKRCGFFPSELGPYKVGPSGSQRLGGPSLIFQAFCTQPGLSRRGSGLAPPRSFPLPLRAWVLSSVTSPVPFPHPLGFPASRLQDWLIKKPTNQLLNISLTLILPALPSHPPCILSFPNFPSPFLVLPPLSWPLVVSVPSLPVL